MTRTQHDSPKKNRLIGAIQAGSTLRKAADLVEIPYPTAKKIWAKFRKTGSTSNRPRSGRPPKVDERTRRCMVLTACRHQKMTYAKIGNSIPMKVSRSTVRRHLACEGYHRWVAQRVPFLNTVQRRKRLMWAWRFRWFKWWRVIWSDECYIHLDDMPERIYITRRADEIFEEGCLIPSFMQSQVCIMVWGCIMQGRKGPLVVLDYPGGKGGGMDATRYREQVLEAVFLEFYKEMRSERGYVAFQQDGAPSHNAKATQKWLSDNNIFVFPHPPSSPDLNPIEHVWHELKRRVRCRRWHPTSVSELKSAVREEWAALDVGVIDKYTSRIEHIVQAVLKAHGGHTRY